MADKKPDHYEETRRNLGIINLLDFSEFAPGDPLLVRQIRKLDSKLKRSAYLRRLAKSSLPILRRAKQLKPASKKTGKRIVSLSGEPLVSTSDPIKLPPFSKKVDVSIVTPVFNKINVTLNCLRSLSKLETKLTFEMIIVDNASSDTTKEDLAKVDNLVYIHNSENLGFVDGCNIGAEKARGDVIVFLNNDTEVTSTWLDLLVNPLSDPTIGLVGSKLLYPNGTLQEAGGIIFKDGSGTNYGKHHESDYFEFNYRRDVDYCSGASIAIHTKLFREFGGFDKRFAPAYYEDTDLAMQVRAKGLRVIYEPSSVAYHIEGETAGTNINSGFKRFQAINQKKFVDKWSKTLQADHYSSEEWYLGRDNSGSKLALIIDDRVPTPDMDAGSLRMVRLIRNIQQLGYKVTFWPKNLKYEPKYVEQLQAEGVEVVYGSVSFLAFATQFGRYYDLVMLSRPYTAASYLEACRAWFYRAILIYDTVDLHFLRTKRQALLDPRNKKELLHHADLYQELELGISHRTNSTLVVSSVEKDMINELDPSIDVTIVSIIHEIVEEAYKRDFSSRHDMVFIGGFDHLPNQDGIRWFCEEVLPIVYKKMPDVKIRIIGPNIPPKLSTALKNTPGVEVLGYVEDISEIFSESRLFVCPLRFGAGAKGKVGQAMEYGVPVVSTPIGVEGMFMKDGESCLIADDAVGFAAAILSIYNDEALWNSVRDKARLVLNKHFSNEAAKKGLVTAIANTKK
jgi:GT2 family glycosyltransferase